VDVPEASLEPTAGWVGQRDEGRAGILKVGEDVAADRGVGTGIVVLILELAEELSGGVPLFGRSVTAVAEDLIRSSSGENQEYPY
jgi:hypothetical protein